MSFTRELRLDGVLGRFVNVTAGRAVYKNAERPEASEWGVASSCSVRQSRRTQTPVAGGGET